MYAGSLLLRRARVCTRLFVSGPLHELADASDPHDPLFRPCDGMITRVRVPRWPGKLRRDLLGYTAEAPLLITNDRGLRKVLISCMERFFALESTLKRSQSALGERWPIEAAFYQTALLHFLHDDDSEVRSDLTYSIGFMPTHEGGTTAIFASPDAAPAWWQANTALQVTGRHRLWCR